MRLRHLEVFNAIMLTGSISAAARLINVTQPAVSRTLQHAESQLGFALFEREKGRRVGTRRSQGNVDELRVATVMALTPEILPRALKASRARQPAISASGSRRCIRPRSSPRCCCAPPTSGSPFPPRSTRA